MPRTCIPDTETLNAWGKKEKCYLRYWVYLSNLSIQKEKGERKANAETTSYQNRNRPLIDVDINKQEK